MEGLKQFKNPEQVANYLQRSGWACSRATVYRHVKGGHLQKNEAGTFDLPAVEAYAVGFLKPDKFGKAKELGELQRRKLEATVLKSEAHAKLLDQKARRESGQLILRSEFERALTWRALILKRDLIQFAFSEAPKIIEFTEGNLEKIPDLVFLMKEKFELFLHRYSNPDISGEAPAEDP